MRALRASDFDYRLPESLIAQAPAGRGHSRLLVLDAEGEARHRTVADLPGLLRPGDLLVVNDTRVIPARLFARRRPGGGSVELLLLEKLETSTWEALAKPAKRARTGTVLELDSGLGAEVEAEGESGRRRLHFSSEVEPHLERLGHVPLPPYIRRGDEAADRASYQTVYARHPGAVAAPTAGLHFSGELFDDLTARGVERAAVTLHVGIGTFRPVSVERVEEHRMEAERYIVPTATAEAIRRTRAAGGRIVAVGTTVVRTLESAALATGEVEPVDGRTELFITPGYRFRAVDVLMTNFHLPRSTLLMMVSAFAGPGTTGRDRVLAAYEEAVAHEYRFYSYGDAMLLERGD
ncbi:MAG: tRNA preQ1(34) S-adenosylmethionine ribosyltransferase-isomerase QueA [bacterium]|nr:tRNA preQ1(34) S-adenosylmethionine ribosyltransferase-isomerase QueA [bacterium]